MLTRRTALIFTDADKANAASAVKEQLSDLGLTVIMIDEMELYADAFKDFLEKVFGIPANLEKRLAIRRERKIRSLTDVTPVSSNLFKPTDPYKRMENILNRYTPEVVVTIGFGAFKEAVAVRDKQSASFKVIAYIDDFALNRQLINTYMDGYVASNMQIKTTLVNAGITEDDVKLASIAVGKRFFTAPAAGEARSTLKIPAEKRTLLVQCSGEGEYKEYFSAAAGFGADITTICYCGENRAAYYAALEAGLLAYNEGTSAALLYAAADAVMTPPESYYAAAALATGKILALTAARDRMEKMNAEFLAPYSEDAAEAYKAENFVRAFAKGEISSKHFSVPASGVGNAVAELAGIN